MTNVVSSNLFLNLVPKMSLVKIYTMETPVDRCPMPVSQRTPVFGHFLRFALVFALDFTVAQS